MSRFPTASSRVILLLLSAALAGLLGARSAAQPAKLNVLFLSVDDLRPALACFGDPLARTPNLDRLAARGVRFEQAHCQFPLCNPSRTSLLTGRYPTTTGVMDNLRYFREGLPEAVTLPQHFRANGYVTARVGKIYHGGIDDEASWQEGAEPRVERRPRTPQQAAQYRMQSDRFVAQEGEESTLGDHRTATRAINLLERHRGGPFFLAVGFAKPHTPLIAPKAYFDLHDPARFVLPPTFAEEVTQAEGAPPGALSNNGDIFIGRKASPDEARRMIHAYYACVSFIDAQIGRVLDALDRLGLQEKTVVAFWGDHGFHLGEKGKWSKHSSLYDPGTRVPMIVSAPGFEWGRRCGRTTGLIDLYPTLSDLCGLPAPAGLEGHSLVPLLRDPARTWEHPARTWARSRPGVGQSVRTERYRLTAWNGGENGFELYDYQKDPHERRNLATDPEYAEPLAQMKKLLLPK